jgi:hypothetical protein
LPGQSLVIIAMAFLGVVAFVGLVVDTGIIYLHRVWLGQAVDAASLAAGYEMPNIKGACARAVEYLKASGYDTGSEFEFQIIYLSRPDAPIPPGDPGEFVIDSVIDGINNPEDCDSVVVPAQHNDMHYEVVVSASQEVSLIFMHLFGFSEVTVGAPSTSKRSARFDVVLVLDRSGSMKFDSCSLLRPDYSCHNRYQPCEPFYTEDFQAYNDLDDLEEAGWVLREEGDVRIKKGGGGKRSLELTFKDEDNPGEIYRTISTVGHENVALIFLAREVNLDADDSLEIFWRPNDEVGWSQIVEYYRDDLGGSLTLHGVMLPSAAYNNPDLQIKFRGSNVSPKRVELDDIHLVSCQEMIGPWIWFYHDYEDGCHPERPLTCDLDDPELLVPGVSYDSELPPRAHLIEQPMTDVLLASEKFIDIIDARHLPEQPREDQIGLVKYNYTGSNLFDLTTDYEALKETLFSSIQSYGGTGTASAMKVGLSILGEGRHNSIHYMILLSDGWPNTYDNPFEDPIEWIYCPGGNPCTSALEYIELQIEAANEQNVTIFTIGLGEDLDALTFDGSAVYGPGTENISGMYILERIANSTGGAAYHAPTTEELEEIFQWIADAIFIRLTR